MKLKAVTCVLNECEFLAEFITRTLPEVDELIIVEGAVEGNPFCTPDGHSVDNTNEILDFYERDDKIIIIRKDGKWDSKQEQKNAHLDYFEDGDWWWGLGADEFYKVGTGEKIRALAKKYPDISEFIVSMKHFWHDEHRIIADKKTGSYKSLQRHQRLFKFTDYMIFVNHPTINDAGNLDIFFHPDYAKKRMILGALEDYLEYNTAGVYNTNEDEEISMYHYSFIRDRLHQMKKHIFYLMRDRDKTFVEAIEILKERTGNDLETIYGYIEQIHNNKTLIDVPYTGTHPLQGKIFEHTNIDLNEIAKEVGDFTEVAHK